MSIRLATCVALACGVLCTCEEASSLMQKQVEMIRSSEAYGRDSTWEVPSEVAEKVIPNIPDHHHYIAPEKLGKHVDDFFMRLQNGAIMGNGKVTNKGECDCLNWKKSYDSFAAWCGAGLEFAQAYGFDKSNPKSLHNTNISNVVGWNTEKDAWALGMVKICGDLFVKIDNNRCMRVAMTRNKKEWFGKEWCYVKSECKDLNGGAPIGGGVNVSAKICGAPSQHLTETDKLFSEMGVRELYEFAQKKKINFALLSKMAYPAESSKWSTVQKLWTPALTGDTSSLMSGPNAIFSTEEWAGEIALGEIIKEKVPTVLDVSSTGGEKVIVQGKRVWRLNGPDEVKYGSVMFGLKCEKNCGPGEWRKIDTPDAVETPAVESAV